MKKYFGLIFTISMFLFILIGADSNINWMLNIGKFVLGFYIGFIDIVLIIIGFSIGHLCFKHPEKLEEWVDDNKKKIIQETSYYIYLTLSFIMLLYFVIHSMFFLGFLTMFYIVASCSINKFLKEITKG